MVENVQKPRKTSKARAAVDGGYRKGEETRQRVLEFALRAFGEASYKAATTRKIADAAGVSLPTLQYHFGGKEGLYRACAEAIVERYQRHTQAAGAAAREALRKDSAPQTARLHLKAVIRALAKFLVGSREAEGWAPFVARELRDPGPAFEILYENLWRPGVLITARLIARILGIPDGDPAARIRALLLISSLFAFQSGRGIALRTMGWSTIEGRELAIVLSGLDAEIDDIRFDLLS
jgi:TetR/AcrR family transcriptional regulator, regulator of cefoperazone and chloramphenicol sensitivity